MYALSQIQQPGTFRVLCDTIFSGARPQDFFRSSGLYILTGPQSGGGKTAENIPAFIVSSESGMPLPAAKHFSNRSEKSIHSRHFSTIYLRSITKLTTQSIHKKERAKSI
jgi:hypothetical protein